MLTVARTNARRKLPETETRHGRLIAALRARLLYAPMPLETGQMSRILEE
jgi:hypothetical protein